MVDIQVILVNLKTKNHVDKNYFSYKHVDQYNNTHLL